MIPAAFNEAAALEFGVGPFDHAAPKVCTSDE
jgi:hypothetical protein